MVVYSVIAEYGFDGLVTATLMAGLILLVAGYFHAGRLIRLIPEPVIDGFTFGIAIIIAASQLKDLFGLQTGPVPADFLEKLPVLWEARASLSEAALLIGLATIALIVAFRKIAPNWPGLIVAVLLTSAAVATFGLPVDTIASRFGALPHSLPWPTLPDLSPTRMQELLPSALLIAFLAGIESLLSAVVADRMIGGRHRPSAELVAQGAANLGSALFGGLPATGAIARTATNVRAGGRTPVAGVVHALVILIFVFVAAPLVSQLAMPALAGLLLVTAWNMAEPAKLPAMLRARSSDAFLFLGTMLLTVVTDLTVAIGAGAAVGLALRQLRREVPPPDWHPRED